MKKSELLDVYYRMRLARAFEMRVAEQYTKGRIGGFCHLYSGEEAVAVGAMHPLQPEDYVIGSYRDHAYYLLRGGDPRKCMAELFGHSDGCCKGKGGSMHMFSSERNFYGGNGIVGAQVPLGVGIAFANKYRDSSRVCLTYFGEGAANQGQVYESFNMASLWKLPVVFVIENNGYAMGTSIQRAKAGTELYRRGDAFGIPGMEVDGMDVTQVAAAGLEAIAHCRAGKGPILMEMKTYRYRGHSMSDPAKYRSREEVQKVRAQRDPIEQLRKRMLDEKLANETAFKDIDREIKAIVAEAAESAQSSPEPEPSELFTDVLIEA